MRRSLSATRSAVKRVWNSRLGKWIVIGTGAAAITLGGLAIKERLKRPPSNGGKPPVIRSVPLELNELRTYSVKELSPIHLSGVIGGKYREMIDSKLVHAAAKEWLDAFNGNQTRLTALPKLSAHTIVAMSEAAFPLQGPRGQLHPNTVAVYLQTGKRLFEQCTQNHNGSKGPARTFYNDPAILRSYNSSRTPMERNAIHFFQALERVKSNGWLNGKQAIGEIYSAMGLE